MLAYSTPNRFGDYGSSYQIIRHQRIILDFLQSARERLGNYTSIPVTRRKRELTLRRIPRSSLVPRCSTLSDPSTRRPVGCLCLQARGVSLRQLPFHPGLHHHERHPYPHTPYLTLATGRAKGSEHGRCYCGRRQAEQQREARFAR